ncbi:hypothetical protein [Siphonobacter sp. BAB-5405]
MGLELKREFMAGELSTLKKGIPAYGGSPRRYAGACLNLRAF